MATMLHPLIEGGLPAEDAGFSGGVLACACAERPVRVRVEGNVAHDHACGCTKCWKPEGAAFSIVAVAPTDKVTVLENGDKLRVVDASALIQRMACTGCGVHLHGPVERDHPFKGLTFVHPELFEESGWARPTFAAFVSSAIEGGVPPSEMEDVRARLRAAGLEPYDSLNPALMDYIATWTVEHRAASSAKQAAATA